MDQGIAILFGAVIGAVISGIIAYVTSKTNLKAVERTANSAIEFQSKTLIADLERTGQEIKAKIGVEVLSKNRQEWINTLREKISEFLNISENCFVSYVSSGGIRDTKDVSHDLKTLNGLYYYLMLLLNPTEGKSNQLLYTCTEIISFLHSVTTTTMPNITSIMPTDLDKLESNLYVLKHQLVEHSQRVLKEEWERVKKGI